MSFERDDRYFYSSFVDFGGKIRDLMPLFAKRDEPRPSAYEEYVPYAQFQRERLSPVPGGLNISHSKSAVDVRKDSRLEPDIYNGQQRRSSAQPRTTCSVATPSSTGNHSHSTSGGNLSIPPSSRRSSVERVIDRQRALANLPHSQSRNSNRLSPSPRSSRPPSTDLPNSATVSTRSCSPVSRNGRSTAYSTDLDDSVSMRTSITDLSLGRSASDMSFSPIHITVPTLPPSPCLGEVLLSLHYDVQMAALDVIIHQARGLPHFGAHKPNPYVKVSLVSKNAQIEVAKVKTMCRKQCVEPVFAERKRFPTMSKSELEQHTLRVAVWHKDLFAHNSIIGEKRIPLHSYPWHNTNDGNGTWITLENKAPTCELDRKIVAKVSLVFKIEDRERKIGTLEVILNTLFLDPPASKRAQHNLAGKIYFNEKRVSKRQVRIPPQTSKGLPIGHAIRFPDQNLNDLHVRSLKLQLWETSGLGTRMQIGTAELNASDHRKGRTLANPCTCELCTGWHKMISHTTHVANVDIKMSGT